MSIRLSRWADTFDPQADYVVRRSFLCSGRVLKPGDPFDKESVRPSTLRGLFGSRDIAKAKPTRPQDGYVPSGGARAVKPAETQTATNPEDGRQPQSPNETGAPPPPPPGAQRRKLKAVYRGKRMWCVFDENNVEIAFGKQKPEAEAIVLAG